MLNLPRLNATSEVVDGKGFPSLVFQKWWQSIVTSLDSAIASVQTMADQAVVTNEEITDLEARVGAVETDKQPLDTTLTGLAALDLAVGLVEQTGPTSFSKRSLGVGSADSIPTRADADGRYFLTPTTAPAAAVVVTSHKVPIVIAGTTYYILLSNI